ncbi:MAG: hypothetical protein ACLP8S_32370 [Solirubrobacteraceae bacterium]
MSTQDVRMPESSGNGGFAAPLAAISRGVVALQHDRRGIVMQLAAINPELADGVQHQARQQRPAIGVKQRIQRTPDTVVVEQCRLPGTQAE